MRVAPYVRRSSPGEENLNTSIESQLEEIGNWCKSNGHTMLEAYRDPGGKSYTLNRPVLQRLMADARTGRFDLVVVWRYDRFSRIQDQQSVAIYQLEQYGVKVIATAQPIPDGPIGTLLRNSYGFVAELELQSIRERTSRGRRMRVEHGHLPAHAIPLFGYLFADERKESYVADPETAPIVRRIFQMALHRQSLKNIASQLTTEGVPTPSMIRSQQGFFKGHAVSHTWSHNMIRKTLCDTAYIGRYRAWKYTKYTFEDEHPQTGQMREIPHVRQRPVDDPEIIYLDPTVCPAIIDPTVFAAIQPIMDQNRQTASRNLKLHDQPDMLLRGGFVTCGYCGRGMRVLWSTPDRQHRYTCANQDCEGYRSSYRTQELDATVWAWICEQFQDPELLKAQYEQWLHDNSQGTSVDHDRLAAVEDLLKAAQRRQENYTKAIGDMDDDDLRTLLITQLKEETVRIANLTLEVRAIQQIIDAQRQAQGAMQGVIDLGQQVAERLGSANHNDRRQILYAFDVQVRCYRRSHPTPTHITWGIERLYAAWEAQQDDTLCDHSHLWLCTQIGVHRP